MTWASSLHEANHEPVSQGPWPISQLRHDNCDCHVLLPCVDHDEYKVKESQIR